MANIIIHLATASAVLIGGGSSAGWAQVVKVQHSVPYESVTESERLYQEDRAETIRGGLKASIRSRCGKARCLDSFALRSVMIRSWSI